MSFDTDIAALRHEALVALVQQLRQQLAERDQQIADLKHQLAEAWSRSDKDGAAVSSQRPTPSPQHEPPLGSQADLLAQLEQLYPEGK